MADILEMFNDFKTAVEKEQFVKQQHKAINTLLIKNRKLEEEVEHLKKLLLDSTTLINSEQAVERIIITPEEALIERQIELIQNRALDRELSLEDTKKLDILLKNKNILKQDAKVVEIPQQKTQPRLSRDQLITIASKKESSE